MAQSDALHALNVPAVAPEARAMAVQRLLAHREHLYQGRNFADATEIIRWVRCVADPELNLSTAP